MPQDLNSTLQQQLRDVHLPDAINWWPLAIGWWLVLALILISIVVLLVHLLRRRKRNSYRTAAQSELQQNYLDWQKSQDTGIYLQSANAILKRSVLHFDSSSVVASVTGKNWLMILNGYSRNELTEETQDALAEACYHPQPSADVDVVHQELITWIRSHRQSAFGPLEISAEDNKVQHA